MNNDTLILTANYAAAYGAKLSGVQVVSAYPITPQSPVMEKIIDFVSHGEMKSEIVTVESEHSAITVCISASAVGARVFTASCANGLALMHEMLHWAAGTRLPIVMAIPNRGMSAPWTILNDQQDSISQRDTGWMQMYCRNSQEVLDSVILGYKIAEQVKVPIMICYDGYILSHTMMPVSIPEQVAVKKFLPDYVPTTILDPADPQNINPVTLADPRYNSEGVLCHGFHEFKYLLQEAQLSALKITESAFSEFEKTFGRKYDLVDSYLCDDADIIAIGLGSIASEALDAVDVLREKGVKAGVLHLRLYRPFPADFLAQIISSSKCKGIIVLEKSLSYGYDGALTSDIKAALFDASCDPFVHSYVMGLGGRDVKAKDIITAFEKSLPYIDKKGKEKSKKLEWINLHTV
jgi:pyruvate/2-oxoacid:ferredoxin oxidoreductase alpha subunit